MAFADIAVPWQGADGAAKRMAADIEKKEVILKKANTHPLHLSHIHTLSTSSSLSPSLPLSHTHPLHLSLTHPLLHLSLSHTLSSTSLSHPPLHLSLR